MRSFRDPRQTPPATRIVPAAVAVMAALAVLGPLAPTADAQRTRKGSWLDTSEVAIMAPAPVGRGSRAKPTRLMMPHPLGTEFDFDLEVLDALNRPVEGVEVLIEPDTGCGTIRLESARTNSAGLVKAIWKTGRRAGVCAAITRVKGEDHIPGVVTMVATNGPARKIVVTKGDQQSAAFGALLPQSLEVQVFDEYGNIARNARLRFEVTKGGGRLVEYAAVPALVRHTDLKGFARANWRLGLGGAQEVRVRILDSDAPSVTIKATGRVK